MSREIGDGINVPSILYRQTSEKCQCRKNLPMIVIIHIYLDGVLSYIILLHVDIEHRCKKLYRIQLL